jgi:3-deoxy-7-phosphoheptulonate synthase
VSTLLAPEDRSPSPRSASPYPKAARAANPGGTIVRVGGIPVGGGTFTVTAGPCAVESAAQIGEAAATVARHGALVLRGGAFKPRTSPYAFPGMGWEGIALLVAAGRAHGLPVVSEVMTCEQVGRMAASVDMLQIGARNMQNFDLLREVGKTRTPVLLKRGMSATIDELLLAAEYVLAGGNADVILCERGIRTFETATRNTLDLAAIPVLKERTHLPVIVDPSHAIGVRRWIRPLCRAAKAVGADGMMVEVHPNPSEACCDKDQALTLDDFARIMDDLARIPSPAAFAE